MVQIIPLTDRACLHIGGADAVEFLHNLITAEVKALPQGRLAFGALLTPQGKVLFDFHIVRQDDGFVLDVAVDEREALLKRLMFYRLRAAVTLAAVETPVFACLDSSVPGALADPRSDRLPHRYYGKLDGGDGDLEDYHAKRIACGVPQSGEDFDLGDVFPHDVLMDQFEGVAFTKGCYVGQEVVSRMHHRGTARNRFVIVHSKDGVSLPPKGMEVLVNDRKIGTMGSSAGPIGLAQVRVDRAATAMSNDSSIMAGDATVTLERPHFATFEFPE